MSSALLRTQSDARLLALAVDGYEAALEALIARYRRPLQRYARRFLSDGLAEDVVQQAFVDLWVKLSDGGQISSVRPWLYRLVRNAALNTIRRAGYRCEQIPEVAELDSPESAFERSASVREALTGLAALPDAQREALMLSAVDGRSRAQIALAMGLSDGAVGQMLYRARSGVRSAMSAVVPLPLAAWAARGARYDAPTAARILQLTATGANGGPAEMLLRGGATLAAIAAVSAAPIVATQVHAHRASPGSGAPLLVHPQPLVSTAFDHPLGAVPPARTAGEHAGAPAQRRARASAASAPGAPAETTPADVPASTEGATPEASGPAPADAPLAAEGSQPSSEAALEPVPAESSPAPEAMPAEATPSEATEALLPEGAPPESEAAGAPE